MLRRDLDAAWDGMGEETKIIQITSLNDGEDGDGFIVITRGGKWRRFEREK